MNKASFYSSWPAQYRYVPKFDIEGHLKAKTAARWRFFIARSRDSTKWRHLASVFTSVLLDTERRSDNSYHVEQTTSHTVPRLKM